MYAIIQAGGKQYEAKPGSTIELEKIPGEVGDEVVLDQVLLLADKDLVQIGRPTLEDVTVKGRIVEQGRHEKIVIFKHKRRKDYRKKQGHRQSFTSVVIESIEQKAADQPEAEADF